MRRSETAEAAMRPTTGAVWRRRARACGAGLAALMLCAVTGRAAASEIYRFTWRGADQYRVEGAFQLREDVDQPIAREEDLRCFEIRGYRGDTAVGAWGLGLLTPETAWRFGFDRAAGEFLVGGLSYGPNGQQWNMFGDGAGCGTGGFGFNAGSAGQDVCVDDRMRSASRIAPGTPLAAERDPAATFSDFACLRTDLVS